jgi:hypothetical protein
MGIIANMLIPGGRPQGLIHTRVIGIAGTAVSCLPPAGAIQPVPLVRPPLRRIGVTRGDRARWRGWRLDAAGLRNRGCARIEKP